MSTERIIIGIDPGTVVMGYGIIRISGRKPVLLTCGVLKLDTDTEHFDRLKTIFDTLLRLIDEYNPDELAIEEPFFGKNVQSMLKLGRAQGVAIAAALHRRMPAFGYTPRKVKQSITGKGAASKEQVAAMVQRLIGPVTDIKYMDATDALAVAICHYYQSANIIASSTEPTMKSSSKSKKAYTGWEAFVAENPERAKD